MYSPLLWLAPDEPLYPMLPHPFAFDGIDNDGDGICDLEDIDELRMDAGDVLDLQRRLSRLGPSRFAYPYSEDLEIGPASEPAPVEQYFFPPEGDMAKQQHVLTEPQLAIGPKELGTKGPIPSKLRAKFTAKGVVLSRYTTLEPIDERVSEIRSYEPVARLDREVISHLPVCSRPPCGCDTLSLSLRDALSTAGIREAGGIEFREGGWFLYGTCKPPRPQWSYRIQPASDAFDVFGAGRQVFTAVRDTAGTFVTITHGSRLPPPRVLYHHNRTRVEDRELTQYWSYYLFDLGTGAHKHDGEHVFSFRDEIGAVRCVVGAGHTDASANNVLVASPEARQNILRPISLPNHMPFLVELGKHASAPDRGLDGRFDIGMDANVFYKDVWGTRDIAAAIGVSSLRPVQPRFAFPRDFSTLIVPREWSAARLRLMEPLETQADDTRENFAARPVKPLDPRSKSGFDVGSVSSRNEVAPGAVDTAERLTALDVVYMLSTEPVASKFRDVDAPVIAGRSERPTASPCTESPRELVDEDGLLTYELFPIEDYEYLVEVLLRNACAGSDTADCVDADSVAQWLDVHGACFWGSQRAEQVRIAPEVFAEMARWPHERDEKRDVWRHNNYRHPNDIFKPWLFPRAALVIASMWESADYRLRGGMRFSTGFTPNSVIELSASFAVKDRAFQDVLSTYYFFRGSHQGWYGSLGRGGGSRGEPFTLVSAGFVPFSWDLPALPFVGKALHRFGHNQLMVHAGLRGEIYGFPDDISPLKFQLGLSLSRSIAASRHPLRY